MMKGSGCGPRLLSRQGGWMSIAGLVVSGVSAISQFANKGGGGKASAAADTSSKYYDTLADISREEYDLWKSEGLPILRRLAGQANLDPQAEADKAATETRTQYAQGRDNARRALEFARNPGDPGYAQIMANSYGNEAQAVSQAMTAAKDRTSDVNFGRALNITNLYKGFAADAQAGLARSGAGAGAAGGIYAGIGRDADARAAQGMYGAVGLGEATTRWLRGINPRATPPTGGGQPDYYGFQVDPGMESAYKANAAAGLPYAEGGKINGPGTGTSDSVHALKKPGTYILSEDTVRALGTKKLRDLSEKAGVRPGDGADDDNGGVPVRLSNGEWAMPPEVTRYYGEEFFNKLQQKYHRPVYDSEGGAANGGAIRMRALPRSVEDAIFRSVPTRALKGV